MSDINGILDAYVWALNKIEDDTPGRYVAVEKFGELIDFSQRPLPDDVSVQDVIHELMKRDWIELPDSGENSFRITAKGQIRVAANVDYADEYRRVVDSLPLAPDEVTKESGINGNEAEFRWTDVDPLLSSTESTSRPPEGYAFLTDGDGNRLVDNGRTLIDRIEQKIPAADRIVTLDHNSANYLSVSTGIAEIFREVRENNQVGDTPEQRDRILHSLQAAQKLWESTELKIIQIQVGVILALEDAGEALRKIGKLVAVGVFVDAIKAIVKATTGIDF